MRRRGRGEGLGVWGGGVERGGMGGETGLVEWRGERGREGEGLNLVQGQTVLVEPWHSI